MQNTTLTLKTDEVLFMLANTCPKYLYIESGVNVSDPIMDHWGQTADTFLHLLAIESGGSVEDLKLREGLQIKLAVLIGLDRAMDAMMHVDDHLDCWD
jgi:hypothetical protein